LVACILVVGACVATAASVSQGGSKEATEIGCLQGLRMRPHHCYLPVHGASGWGGLMEVSRLRWMSWTSDSAVARGFVLDSKALDPDGKRSAPSPVRLVFGGSQSCGDTATFARLRVRWIDSGRVQPMLLSCPPAAAKTARRSAGGPQITSGRGTPIVAKGQIGSHHWTVEVVGDGSRKGICMETRTYLRRQAGGEAFGTCSAPAVRRGLIASVAEDGQSGRPALTVLGAAFDLAVRRVDVTLLDGRSERLRLRRARRVPAGAGEQVKHFRYVIEARAGAWCVRSLVTRDRAGTVLWEASGAEMLPYDPVAVCGGARGT
jgi:hypothetical protein